MYLHVNLFLMILILTKELVISSQPVECRICSACGNNGSFDKCVPHCGVIVSMNHPSQYPNNHRCRWEIMAATGYYINLTFNDNFDVPSTESTLEGDQSEGSCMFDHVSVFDSRFDRLLGRFCNNKRPPPFLLSPWNKLRIVFNTDSKNAGRGFNITVKSSKFTLPSELKPYLQPVTEACPDKWSYYRGHCYRAFKEQESLQWYKAEEKCSELGKGRDGHLVSIQDEKEMKVVHYLLTSVWKSEPNTSFYIGLIDVSKEGVYRWSDNNPMSYTDWAKGARFGDETANQPDGGAYEDCTIIKFDSIHSTENWHDIPCSLGKNSFLNLSAKHFEDVIDSYICKMDAKMPPLDNIMLRKNLYEDVLIPNDTIIRKLAVRERYFVCQNMEVVSVLQRCDGNSSCRDGSDEAFGCPQQLSGRCLPFQFRCANRRCISIAYTCNFVDDCGDGSDEKNCYIRPCRADEFKCNSGQCIPINKRCNLLNDCKDGSDEGPVCSSKGYCNPQITFQCYYGNCIPLEAVCDRHRDCPGKFHEDEQESSCYMMQNRSLTLNRHKQTFLCQSGQRIDPKFKCIFEFDQYGYQIGCRDVSHLRGCEKSQCSRDYVKCPNSYCIPPRYICDGKRDCVGGEDEIDCKTFECPGSYRCINNNTCILFQNLCDSIRHCPHGDDEWFCDLKCPAGCDCIGLYVNCASNNFTQLPFDLTREVRKLDFSDNHLGPTMDHVDFRGYYHIVELILQFNRIEVLRKRKFIELKNLQHLDLRYNRIYTIESAAFAGLILINTLLLDGNPNISVIEPTAFIGLTRLTQLNISNTSVRKLKSNAFSGLTNLQKLTFRHSNLEAVESGAFLGLNSVTSLDLYGNDIRYFKKDIFTGLLGLKNLSTSSFKFCCIITNPPFNIPFDRCLPPPDEISDCEDLMSSPVQRAFLWIMGTIALGCNIFVIIWRIRIRSSPNKVSSLLILSLGFADCLMGVYMLIIASVDVYYRGRYVEVSDMWRNSVLCKICGFLSTVSTEAGVFTLVFIAIDRLICICFPFSKYRLTSQFAFKLIFCSWVVALLISALPLMAKSYFHDQFYARSGVCLALHITNKNPAGWEYSVAVFLFLNLIAFLIIVSCYVYMYKVVLESQRRMSQVRSKQVRERQIGRQMAMIVGSNFLCWFPIIIMGLMAINGYRLPATVYSWTAVFVLPLNSATNPIVYTLAELKPSLFRPSRRDSLTNKFLVSKNSNSAGRQRLVRQYKPPYGYMRLSEFLKDSGGLQVRFLLEITCSLCEQLKDLHERGYALGGVEIDNVFVSRMVDAKYLRVYLPDYNAFKVTDSSDGDDYALDMEDLGMLVKRMLTMYTSKRNLSFVVQKENSSH